VEFLKLIKDLTIPIAIGATVFFLVVLVGGRPDEKEQQQDAAIEELQKAKLVNDGLQLELWALERVLLKNNIVNMGDLAAAKADVKNQLLKK